MNIGFTGHRNKLTDPAELRQLETDYPGAVWIHGGAQYLNKFGTDLDNPKE